MFGSAGSGHRARRLRGARPSATAWTAAIAILVGSIAGCGDEPVAGPADTQPDARFDVVANQDIVYMTEIDGRGRDMVMDRFVPDADGTWPVVLLLHGGGTTGRTMEPVAQALAQRGVIVYAPTYPINQLLGASVSQAQSGSWVGNTLLGDLSCAVRAARADAPRHSGDPDRLVLAGYSMGAALGATVALIGDDGRFTAETSGTCVTSHGSSTPSAFFGWEGPYVWSELADAEFPELLAADPQTMLALGPLPHLDQQPPDIRFPFHLRSGDQDYRGSSSAEHLAAFNEALTDAGWAVTTDVLPGKFHTDFIDAPLLPEMNELIVEIAYDPSG